MSTDSHFESSPPQPPPPPPADNGDGENAAPGAPPASRSKRSRGTGCLVAALIVALVLCGGLGLALLGVVTLRGMSPLGSGSPGRRVIEQPVETVPGAEDKIVIINVKGVIHSNTGYRGAESNIIRRHLQKAIEDPHVRAVVLDLDTPGGEVTASDEIHAVIREVSLAGKPVVACMRSVCASGGYYVASACDHIVANRVTLTGSIGVMFPHFRYKELLEKIGVSNQPYTSGRLKDMLSGGVERTEAEKKVIDAHMQQIVDQTFRRFLEVVAQGRDAFGSVEDARRAEFADGRIVLGAEAKGYGLVDSLGYLEDAVERARSLAKAYDTNVVRYREPLGLAEILMSAKQDRSIRLETGLESLLPQTSPYRLYYLMPALQYQ